MSTKILRERCPTSNRNEKRSSSIRNDMGGNQKKLRDFVFDLLEQAADIIKALVSQMLHSNRTSSQDITATSAYASATTELLAKPIHLHTTTNVKNATPPLRGLNFVYFPPLGSFRRVTVSKEHAVRQFAPLQALVRCCMLDWLRRLQQTHGVSASTSRWSHVVRLRGSS